MRLRPRTVTGQFALLLVAALVSANEITLIVLSAERERVVEEARRGAEVERLASLAAALEAVPADLRASLAEAASSPALRLQLTARPVAPVPRSRRARRVARAVQAAAARTELVREVRAGTAWVRRQDGGRGHRHTLLVSLALTDGTWLNARIPRRTGTGPVIGRTVVTTLACPSSRSLPWASSS
ncbi:hypothetical protein [Acuticoccus sp.]|uniref:hypothetical protein n=1 Tax=Acuticoccus sp. TaxID=1904378 RepID=UPI003B525349